MGRVMVSNGDFVKYRELILHELERLDGCNKEQDHRLNNFIRELAVIKIKVALIAGAIGAVGGAILTMLGKIILKKIGL